MPNAQLYSETQLPSFFAPDVWDAHTSRSRPVAASIRAAYANEARLDVQVALEFTADASLLLASGPSFVRVLRVEKGGRQVCQLVTLTIEEVATRLGGGDDIGVVGGPACISPDGKSVAWVVYVDVPAVVYGTFWDVARGCCVAFCELGKIAAQRFSTLGWARMAYVPNGRYCVMIVNTARTMMQMEREDNRFQRTTLCQFLFAVYDVSQGFGEGRQWGRLEAVKESFDWLKLEDQVYARQLAGCVAAIVDGLCLHDTKHVYNRDVVTMNERDQLNCLGFVVNCLHSSPTEATYKALTFGSEGKHAWFITKQPMYSMHFSMDASRILVAPSPHVNVLRTIVRREGEVGGEGWAFVEREEVQEKGRGDVERRKFAFEGMPSSMSYNTVTAFSSSGKWLLGASLLDDDTCYVSLRNLTIDEYFA